MSHLIPQDEDFEEGELEEVELVALAFDISIDKLPSGVSTAKQLCALVTDIVRKAAPNIPSDKALEDMGVAEEALLVVASTDNDDDPFRPQDDVRKLRRPHSVHLRLGRAHHGSPLLSLLASAPDAWGRGGTRGLAVLESKRCVFFTVSGIGQVSYSCPLRSLPAAVHLR